MKVSIVTVVYNNAATIAHAIDSVLAQDYADIEYIIVDGKSTDGTVEIVKSYGERVSKFISEADKGIYDAMNKGIKVATGDVVGILNADDFFYSNDTVSKIASAFIEDKILDATIGDIVFIKDEDHDKTLRHYCAKNWRPSRFAWGYMPPHPSFFCKKHVYEKYGYYEIDYKIAADYELLIRFLLVNKVHFKYLPFVTTKMRMGGASTRNINSIITLNREIKRGCEENKVYTNYLMIYSKYFFKPFEFLFN
ncbi:MAG TPA: glycosyltransferase family 2 protein [Flavipsychrobacter sp.]|nr:glycosyltransferase family 2 protein [Flavipsychrobacter sp.]